MAQPCIVRCRLAMLVVVACVILTAHDFCDALHTPEVSSFNDNFEGVQSLMPVDPADRDLRKGVLVAEDNSGGDLLSRGVLTPAEPVDGDLGEVQGQTQPPMDPARASYVKLLQKAEGHLCTDKTGIFCTLANSLKDTYLDSPTADFLEVLGNMHGHYCASGTAAATEQCKLLKLLAKSVPPVKIHTFSQIDKQPLIQIDENVEVGKLNDKTDGSSAAVTFTNEERQYMDMVVRVSSDMCNKQGGSLLCHLSMGFEKHYKQALAAGDNSQYVDFIQHTKDFYCKGDGGAPKNAECKLFPHLLSGIPPPHSMNSGTAKILKYLKVLDHSVNWYCKSSHESFCHLAPGLKQAFLTSLKDHEPKTYLDYVSQMQSHYCTDQKADEKPCQIYALLKKGVPDLVHHDLDVDGLKTLPALYRFMPHSQQPSEKAAAAAAKVAESMRVPGQMPHERLGSGQSRKSSHEVAATEQEAKGKVLNRRVADSQKAGTELIERKKKSGKPEPKEMSTKKESPQNPTIKQSTQKPQKQSPQKAEASKKEASKETRQPKTGTEYPNVVLPSRDKRLPTVNIDKTLHELELGECAKEGSTTVFCQMSRALNQVFDKDKASAKFYKLLASITGHYCVARKGQHQSRCAKLEEMLAGHEQAKHPAPAAVPASGHMTVAPDGQVKHTPA